MQHLVFQGPLGKAHVRFKFVTCGVVVGDCGTIFLVVLIVGCTPKDLSIGGKVRRVGVIGTMGGRRDITKKTHHVATGNAFPWRVPSKRCIFIIRYLGLEF